MSLLIDTGIVYAYYDRADRWHNRARAVIHVDASIVALTETLGIRRVATTDRRHFDVLASRFSLELLP